MAALDHYQQQAVMAGQLEQLGTAEYAAEMARLRARGQRTVRNDDQDPHMEGRFVVGAVHIGGDTHQGPITSDELRIVPETRRNEVLGFVRSGLQDFSVSRTRARSRGWGIPVPGDPDQVVYVWFDALTNYITALDYASDGPLYERFWLRNPHRVHVIGKGIVRFHAVYWPAMLLSAGVPLPSDIFVHGYLTAGGRKISKSGGNAVDPVAWAQRFGTDALRYYLLRHVRATEDADFALEPFVHAYNADLADQLGNLVSRVASMIER
jgi:methionyl-tRNA synthetase